MINLENVLVLDIETAPAVAHFNQLDETWQALWTHKATRITKDNTAEEAYQRAGIYAEFGKVICIAIGVYHYQENRLGLRVKSFEDFDEKTLLKRFSSFLQRHYNTKEHQLVAHNGKEFDYPYLCRRMIANGIKLPEILKLSGKKPWEVQHLDTMEFWKFGDYKSYTSLSLLAVVLGLENPKEDMDGSQVAFTYHQERNLEKIAQYCKKDVVTTAQVLVRMQLNTCLLSADIQLI